MRHSVVVVVVVIAVVVVAGPSTVTIMVGLTVCS